MHDHSESDKWNLKAKFIKLINYRSEVGSCWSTCLNSWTCNIKSREWTCVSMHALIKKDESDELKF